MSSFEAFSQAPKHEVTPAIETAWDTPSGATELLMKLWDDYVHASQSSERQVSGTSETDSDASNLLAEHIDQQDEDRIIESWADEVPDAIKPEVAVRLRRDAAPGLIKLLDKYSKNFSSLSAS